MRQNSGFLKLSENALYYQKDHVQGLEIAVDMPIKKS